MASTIIHLAIISETAKRLHISDRQFLLGSLLPDFSAAVNNHYRVENPKTKEKTIDLCRICEDLFDEPEKADPARIGFYLHLVQDRLFCRFLIEQCGSYICTENTKRLYHDYALLNRHLIDRYELTPLSDVEFIAEDSFLNRKYRIDEAAFRKSMHDYFNAPFVEGQAFILTEERAEQYIQAAVEASVSEFNAVREGCPPYDKTPYYWIRHD